MQMNERIDALLASQSTYFNSGATIPQKAREEHLQSLLAALHKFEDRIVEACHVDLGRGVVEARASDVSLPVGEATLALRSLRAWMRPKRSLPPLVNLPAVAAVHHRPLGLNLIVAPWNYPFLLMFGPLVSCIAAGNVAILKPSELAPASSRVIAELVGEAFDEACVAVVEGGIEVSQALLARRFDHYFFTGSTRVGRIVAKAAAEHLARATLELGGKSPTIVTASANLDVAARRIVMGKFFNTGQSCVAPDYVLVERQVHDELLGRVVRTIREFFGPDPQASADYGRIVNDTHFDRIVRLIDPSKVRCGGVHDRGKRYIEPTVLTNVEVDDPIMQEEIFGPLLPMIAYDDLVDAIGIIDRNPNPLALYIFTADPEDERKIGDRVPFGGGCINTTLLQFTDPGLPLGGIGSSGIGHSHGFHGFETFSHRQGILRAATFIDPDLRYPPYTARKQTWIRRLMG